MTSASSLALKPQIEREVNIMSISISEHICKKYVTYCVVCNIKIAYQNSMQFAPISENIMLFKMELLTSSFVKIE